MWLLSSCAFAISFKFACTILRRVYSIWWGFMNIDPSAFLIQRIIIHGTLPWVFNISFSWYLFQVKENQGPKQVMRSSLECPRPKGGKMVNDVTGSYRVRIAIISKSTMKGDTKKQGWVQFSNPLPMSNRLFLPIFFLVFHAKWGEV